MLAQVDILNLPAINKASIIKELRQLDKSTRKKSEPKKKSHTAPTSTSHPASTPVPTPVPKSSTPPRAIPITGSSTPSVVRAPDSSKTSPSSAALLSSLLSVSLPPALQQHAQAILQQHLNSASVNLPTTVAKPSTVAKSAGEVIVLSDGEDSDNCVADTVAATIDDQGAKLPQVLQTSVFSWHFRQLIQFFCFFVVVLKFVALRVGKPSADTTTPRAFKNRRKFSARVNGRFSDSG